MHSRPGFGTRIPKNLNSGPGFRTRIPKNPTNQANNPGNSTLTYVLESRTTNYIHVRTYVLESRTTNPCSYLCPGVQDYKSVFILMSWNPGLKAEYIIIPHSHTIELAAVIAERLRPGHEEQPNK